MFRRLGSNDTSKDNWHPPGMRTERHSLSDGPRLGAAPAAPVRTYNGEMFVLRYLYILALGVWLGGMAVAGLVAAPTIFAVLEAWNPVEGRVLAGQVFGNILARLHLILYGAAA